MESTCLSAQRAIGIRPGLDRLRRDEAVYLIMEIHEECRTAGSKTAQRTMVVIERSLGNPKNFKS
jgi:hypothetical protein